MNPNPDYNLEHDFEIKAWFEMMVIPTNNGGCGIQVRT